ncbi:hypothetical protein [Holophaga foetida]|uniref:hypothetical protein n=1 Tax=Holophaga foetida TaxID=35839 RepID=UPI00030B6062|nr:hypothetical protein [Holophaga foetida]
MAMDALTLMSYAAASMASQSQGRLQGLIVAAGQDPSAESITAAKQAQVRSEEATLVLAKAIAATEQAGADLVALMDQGAGLGRSLDTYT